MKTENLLVDGVRVFVRRTGGEGAPVVFVHGHWPWIDEPTVVDSVCEFI